jgi:UDPglucose 6-dehydrogenase
LREKGALLKLYDPIAGYNFAKEYKSLYREEIDDLITDDMDKALDESDVCFVLTEWDNIRFMERGKILKLMKTPIIIDGRNCMLLENDKDIKLKCIGK